MAVAGVVVEDTQDLCHAVSLLDSPIERECIMRTPARPRRHLAVPTIRPSWTCPTRRSGQAKLTRGGLSSLAERPAQSPPTQEPAVSSGFLGADDGTRTHDLLHGKPLQAAIVCSLVQRKGALSRRNVGRPSHGAAPRNAPNAH